MHGEDYDLFMRLGKTWQLANLATPFVVMDVRPDSLSSNRQRNLISRLQLLTSYFDPRSVHAYLGIAANLLLLLVPRPLMFRFRRWVGRLRGAKPVAAAAQRWRHTLSGSDFGRPFPQSEHQQQSDPVRGVPQQIAEHDGHDESDHHAQERGGPES